MADMHVVDALARETGCNLLPFILKLENKRHKALESGGGNIVPERALDERRALEVEDGDKTGHGRWSERRRRGLLRVCRPTAGLSRHHAPPRCFASYPILSFSSSVDLDNTDIHSHTMPPTTQSSNAPVNVKLLLIGNSSVGKSSLLLRFSDEQWLPEDESSATIGVDFRVRVYVLSIVHGHSFVRGAARYGPLVAGASFDAYYSRV